MPDTDKELLERAARAAGYKLDGTFGKGLLVIDGERAMPFDPLTDDGDNARLEAACEINIEWQRIGVIATKLMPNVRDDVRVRVPYSDHNGDKQKARRYASTRAAASLCQGGEG